MAKKPLSFDEYSKLSPEDREIVRLEMAAELLERGATLHRVSENTTVEQLLTAVGVSGKVSPNLRSQSTVRGDQIRPGNVLQYKGEFWAAVKVDHVKPGSGEAFAQVELRNLRNGSKLIEQFQSGDYLERVTLKQKDQQFLYEADGMLVFMDTGTYEQVSIPSDLLGDRRPFLQDGMVVTIEYSGEEVLNISLPQKSIHTVIETATVVKGQGAAKSLKRAVLDNGVTIMVPPFVQKDEEVVVDTETTEFVERH